MRELHLYADRQGQPKGFVQGLNAAAPLTSLRETQGDTLTIYVHDFERNPAIPALTTFVEKPLSASAVRAAIGYIDAPPESGTFRLKVDDQTTTALTWPSDLSTPSLIATWKAAVLAALQALSNVGVDGVRLDDPAETPAHIFYFTWTDTDRLDEIEVVSNRLIPWTEPTVAGSAIPVGYTQQVKLARFPLRMSGPFAQATTPPAVIFESRPGATGSNAEQTLVIPAAATGSFSLAWSGASTKTMAVSSVTAASLAAALNAIVAEGATNPSFRVEARTQREGKRLAIEFIGPLAGEEQDALIVTMHDQQGAPWWVGTILLDGLGLEMALNGAATVDLTAEIVITDAGEETYLLPITIENDMTRPTTAASAAAAGAVLVEIREVLVDAGLGEAFVEAAPGRSVVPEGPGSVLVIAHPLTTWRPRVVLTLHEVDHEVFAADPEDLAAAITGTRQLDDGEYEQKALSDSTVRITLPWELVDDPEDPLDYRLLAIDISTPITELTRFEHKHLWTDIRETLPAGTTLAAKLAAIDAALGVFGGSLQIPAANITGTLTAAQIDLASLNTAQMSSATFISALNTVLGASTTILSTISAGLTQLDTFVTNLSTLITTNTTLGNSIVTMLGANNNFPSLITEAVQNVLSGGGPIFPEGVIPITISPVLKLLPSGRLPLGLDLRTLTTGVVLLEEPPPSWIKRPAGLLPAMHKSAATTFSDPELPPSPTSGTVYQSTGTPDVIIPSGFGLRGSRLKTGEYAAYLERSADLPGQWYRVTRSGSTTSYFPTDLAEELFRIELNDAMLSLGGVFTVQFTLDLGIVAGNVTAQTRILIEHGTASSQSTPSTPAANLDTVTWNGTPLLNQEIKLTGTRQLHAFGARVSRSASNVVTAEQLKYLTWATAGSSPASANFYLRARLCEFDTENAIADPRGYFYLAMPAVRAGVL
jgi:hypothetical protein